MEVVMAGVRQMGRIAVCLVLGVGVARAATVEHPRVRMETTAGAFTLELAPERTPATVANFLAYVADGFYDGLIFHRVVRGALIQSGAFAPRMVPRPPTRDAVANEADRGLPLERYAIAMARGADAGSQFFISLRDDPGQRSGICAFGRVVEGMAVIDSIARTRTVMRGGRWEQPAVPVVILSARRLAT
jgi:peptidyl-prolyl cis-trans isomerase A (cyclophilin A)